MGDPFLSAKDQQSTPLLLKSKVQIEWFFIRGIETTPNICYQGIYLCILFYLFILLFVGKSCSFRFLFSFSLGFALPMKILCLLNAVCSLYLWSG